MEKHKTVYVHHAQNLPIQHLPTLQDAAGVVILVITKVAIIALLALHVQQDSMNQKLYIHTKSFCSEHACPNSNSEFSGE